MSMTVGASDEVAESSVIVQTMEDGSAFVLIDGQNRRSQRLIWNSCHQNRLAFVTCPRVTVSGQAPLSFSQ